VNRKLQAFFLANRGEHIELAAPGVNILHAIPGNNMAISSGTSYAAPFVSAFIATQTSLDKEACEISKKKEKKSNTHYCFNNILDLGEPGIDAIYGHGLVLP